MTVKVFLDEKDKDKVKEKLNAEYYAAEDKKTFLLNLIQLNNARIEWCLEKAIEIKKENIDHGC